jgi:hypothetical protein
MCVQVTKTANRFEISSLLEAVGMHKGGFSHRRVADHFRVIHSIIVRLMQLALAFPDGGGVGLQCVLMWPPNAELPRSAPAVLNNRYHVRLDMSRSSLGVVLRDLPARGRSVTFPI